MYYMLREREVCVFTVNYMYSNCVDSSLLFSFLQKVGKYVNENLQGMLFVSAQPT